MTGDSSSQETLARGTRLGRYEIRQMLGQGGMGQVYRAWDVVLQRDVAVKVLGLPDAELLRRFAREAEAISRLDHVNIVSIHDFHADPAQPYIVMEYLRGEDLAARLRRGPMQVTEAVDMILGVCAGVAACHALGIVHRDLKPGNVFLHQTAELGVVVKVLDFGVARLRQEISEELTQPGQVVGTPRYLSPEQVEHKEADARSDQYAIGHILYTALTGKSPFAGQHGVQLIRGILGSEYQGLRELRPDLPVGLVDAVEQAMSVVPARRYPSVLTLGQAIARCAADDGRPIPDVFAARVELTSSTEPSGDLSRTIADRPAARTAAVSTSNTAVRQAAAAAVETLEGDESRPSPGPVVVPVAPFEAMPVVSTTARLPTETAIDTGYAVRERGPVLAATTASPHRPAAPVQIRPGRRQGRPAVGARPDTGITRSKLLLVVLAALLLVALTAVALVARSCSAESMRTAQVQRQGWTKAGVERSA